MKLLERIARFATSASPTDFADVAIHVGLPKTATSFLQSTVFANSEQLNLIHRKTAPDQRDYFNKVLRGIVKPKRKDVFGNLQKGRLNVISDENISITSSSFWKGKDTLPGDVAERVLGLSKMVTGKARSFRVIMTIRRQDRWLASRYAESAKNFKVANQSDFEHRVAEVLSRSHDESSWLNYNASMAALSRKLGSENVLMLMQEDLERDPATWIRTLETFLGVTDLASALGNTPTRRRNVLSTPEGKWELRKHASEIELSDDLSRAILERFSESNRKLVETFSIDGSRYGYF